MRRLGLGPTTGTEGLSSFVEVWLVAVDREAVDLEDVDVLDEVETEQLHRLIRPEDRRRYLVAHVALRRILGARLGCPAGQVALGREPCPVCGGAAGRPTVDGPGGREPVHFSLSHDQDLVLIGLSNRVLGVDVQGVPPSVDGLVAVLTESEQGDIRGRPGADQPMAFARAWTRKEAYLKAVGTGLAHGGLGVSIGSAGPAEVPYGWRLHHVDVGPDYAAAIALPARKRTASQAGALGQYMVAPHEQEVVLPGGIVAAGGVGERLLEADGPRGRRRGGEVGQGQVGDRSRGIGGLDDSSPRVHPYREVGNDGREPGQP